MEGRWCSAVEVAADVSRAGGGGGATPIAPIANACLAWSARPAPLILTESDLVEEPPAQPAPEPPDLRGITRMLRMVQTEDTDEDSSAPGDIVISKLGHVPASTHCTPGGVCTHLTTIYLKDANSNGAIADNVMTSDLNPNVAEFVPRSVPRAPRASSDGIAVTEHSAGYGTEGRPSEREDLVARLRDDISGGREKYSAIARLMRLYAQPASSSAPAAVPRLLTPEHFERAAAPERAADGNLDGYSSQTTGTASELIESVGSNYISPMVCERQPSDELEVGVESHDERASVDKVRRWLGEGEGVPPRPSTPVRGSPRLFLTPVTFRSRAPSSSARCTPPPPSSAPAARAYSPPPDAAAALHREYAARAAAAHAAAPPPDAADTLWTRLEARLRQKDAELRARRR